MRRMHFSSAAVALAFLGSAAQAHPKLVTATPSANATVASPPKITLQFSEKLMPAFSKAELIMAPMPGMGAMKMASTATVGSDGRSLVVTPASRLPRGRYTVSWQVVSADTHKIAGKYDFAVK